MTNPLTVEHDVQGRRFCATLEGYEACLMYRLQGRELDLYHTYVPEAFRGRGKGDFYGSEDIEDIVAVLDGAEDAREKVQAASPALQGYLRDQFVALLRDELFTQCVPGHLGPKAAGRASRVLQVLGKIAG